ncbi:MAG: metalloregulator ArsR/SmtB family transcription factor [Dehalococcoidia bacterium]
MTDDDRLQVMLRFFKVMADETRLRIVGILAGGERSVEELSRLLRLTSPTVSHHLARLKDLALVEMRAEGTTHLYHLNDATLRTMSREILVPGRISSSVASEDSDAWERKILRDFFDGERLKEIPASRKKREVILRWLVRQFEPGVRYQEPALNEIIKRHHPDAATLRREMIGHRLMQRDQGIYWRTPEPLDDAYAGGPDQAPWCDCIW